MSNTLACPHPLLGAPRCQFSLGGLDPGEGTDIVFIHVYTTKLDGLTQVKA
jgi:hypothetical protein